MAKKARRVPRRVSWQDELSLTRIDEIITHFTVCRDLYQQSHTDGLRDYTLDIARVTRCADVWTDARAIKERGGSITSLVETLRLNAPEKAIE